VDFGAELQVVFPDFGELVGDGIERCDNGHYARDGGTENGEGAALTGHDGMDGVRGEILDKVGVELEAILGLREHLLHEGERGGGAHRAGW